MATGSPPRQMTTSRSFSTLSLSGSPRTPRCTNSTPQTVQRRKVAGYSVAQSGQYFDSGGIAAVDAEFSLSTLRSTINVALQAGHSVNEAEQSAPHWWHSWLAP